VAHGWALSFNEAEALLLVGALRQLAKHYTVKVEDLPSRLQEYWVGRLSANTQIEEDLSEEREALAEERKLWRSERLVWIEEQLKQYPVGKPWLVTVDAAGLETLLCVINDRRLLLAVDHAVTEAEMDMDPEALADEARRHVLWEIHLLAIFQERCLAALSMEEPPDRGSDEVDLLES
jgi:hypothetical protein